MKNAFQVDPEATDKEIKNAYKKLAKENHPDRFSGQNLSNEEKKDLDLKFQRIAKAYETLKSNLPSSFPSQQFQASGKRMMISYCTQKNTTICTINTTGASLSRQMLT